MNRIGDPEEQRRVDSAANQEAALLGQLRAKNKNQDGGGGVTEAERIQLNYLEARFAAERKRREWEAQQEEVQAAYELARKSQLELEAQRRREAAEAALLASQEAEARAVERAAEEAERVRLEQEVERQRLASEAAVTAARQEVLQGEADRARQRAALEEADNSRWRQATERMQQRLESSQQHELAGQQQEFLQHGSASSSSQPLSSGGGVGGGSGGAVASAAAAAAAALTALQSGNSGINSLLPGPSIVAETPPRAALLMPPLEEERGGARVGDTGPTTVTLSQQINGGGACKLPMISFEVAVLALAVFFSPSGISADLTEFLLLSDKFFGTFCALAAAVSVATPGGELVMLCCVEKWNDLFMRTWALLFVLVLCFKAVLNDEGNHQTNSDDEHGDEHGDDCGGGQRRRRKRPQQQKHQKSAER